MCLVSIGRHNNNDAWSFLCTERSTAWPLLAMYWPCTVGGELSTTLDAQCMQGTAKATTWVCCQYLCFCEELTLYLFG